MRHTLADLIGEVHGYLLDPDALPGGAVVWAINQGYQAVANAIRDNWNMRTEQVAYATLRDGEDLVDLPADAGHLTKVERLDLGSVAVPLWPVNRGQSHLMDQGAYPWASERYEYTQLEGSRIRLAQVPQATTERGIRFQYLPLLTPLRAMTDTPALPEDIHEHLVVEALDRLRQKARIRLADPRTFEGFRARAEAALTRYLNPTDLASGGVVEPNSFYFEEE